MSRRGICAAVVGTGILVGISASGVSAAWQKEFHVTRWELKTGYGYQYTHAKSRPNNFQIHLLLPSAVIPLTAPVGPSWLRGQLEWNPELMLAVFSHPNTRPMLGITPLQFQYSLKPAGKWSLFAHLGAGFLWANINTRETRSDWNFNLQEGIGVRYRLSSRASLLVEYRHIHISNAGLHENNSGLNSNTFLAGLSLER